MINSDLKVKNDSGEIRFVKSGEIIDIKQLDNKVIIILNDETEWISDLKLVDAKAWMDTSNTSNYKNVFKHILPKKN